MKTTFPVLGSCISAVFFLQTLNVLAGDPPLDASAFLDNSLARMEATHRSGVLFAKFEIARIEICFGASTSSELKRLSTGRELSAELEDQIAGIAFNADDVLIRVEFKRNLSLDRLLSELRRNVRMVHQAGIIDPYIYRETIGNLPRWYDFLESRGPKEGDQMLYRVGGDGLRAQYLRDKQVLGDQFFTGSVRRDTILGGYFAPKSSYRKDLIRSLFSSGSAAAAR
ncbi:MAG: hypothetical protein JSU96_05795 [Acidobacteriota bacterium]|nr:MAG: hypothetical protein JSU96_05795 [Acidobacteriota bacterium]